MLPTGLYGVGKAAVHPPALAVLSHTPDGATQTIAWVGKGIVYDTGGLSIKGKVRCWALLRWAAGRRGPRGLISPQALERGDQVSGGSEPLGAGFRGSIHEAGSLSTGSTSCPHFTQAPGNKKKKTEEDPEKSRGND